MSSNRDEERRLIEEFVVHLGNLGYQLYRVDRWPEDENRSTPEVDAIVARYAIEHTSIDTLDDQRLKDAWFMEAVGSLERELHREMRSHLSIQTPYEPLARKINKPAVKAAFREWIRNETGALAEGHTRIDGIPGFPFPLNVWKQSTTEPGIHFSRNRPDDDTLPQRLYDLVHRKAAKLDRYSRKGFRTMLLVESDDIALMNDEVFMSALTQALGKDRPSAIDEYWYADTSCPGGPVFLDATVPATFHGQRARYVRTRRHPADHDSQ